MPHILNSKSPVQNRRDFKPTSLPPILKGEYEHYELLGIKDGQGGLFERQVQTTYPEIEVVQFCTDARKPIPSGRKTRPEELVAPSPILLGMALADSDSLSISVDKISWDQKKAGWTWTFTPAIHG